MNAPVQQATIRQYAKQLQLRTIGRQFAEVAEQAIRQKQSHSVIWKRYSGPKWKSETAMRSHGGLRRRISLR